MAIEKMDFIVVGSPALSLTFVGRSDSYPGEDWTNAVDGDIQDWDGTVSTQGGSPPHGIFDLGQAYTIDRVRLLTDTGVGFSERWVTDFSVLVSSTGTAPQDFVEVVRG